MDSMLIVGLAVAILAVSCLAVFTGLKKKKGGKINFGIAAGLIMGTLVGGTSTVGTAQLAFNYGMTAWWFTLGAGLGCLILALVYVRPLRRQSSPTLVGMVRDEYGKARIVSGGNIRLRARARRNAGRGHHAREK